MSVYVVKTRPGDGRGRYARTGDAYEVEALADARAHEYAVQGYQTRVETLEESDAEDLDVSHEPAPVPEPAPAVANPLQAQIAALQVENARLRADQAELARVQAAMAEPAFQSSPAQAGARANDTASPGTEGSH